jgi:phosphatidylglycerophosphatase C
MSLVLFDFDGTLTTRDTVLPLGLFLARTAHAKKRLRVVYVLLLLTALKLRILSNHRFKERFCRLLLRGKSENEIDTLAQLFVDSYVNRILNKTVVDAMRGHQRNGDEVYVVSSNFSFLLRHLMRAWGFQGVIGTDAEVEAGRFTGGIRGRVCDGGEKLSRVLAIFGRERVRSAVAYGDSRSDHYLLEFVKTGIWV